jgi:glycosyltransferase involved in cell wall biosynthesis
MRILWAPHGHWSWMRHGQRESYLTHYLKDVHEVHVMSWKGLDPVRDLLSPTNIADSLRARSTMDDGRVIHEIRRFPSPPGYSKRTGHTISINQWLFQKAMRDIVRREQIDLVVCGIGHRAVGLPPADLPVPLVFDYLDFSMDGFPELETAYLERADAVLCTATTLMQRAQRFNPHCYYLPNGADIDGLRQADPRRVRARHGLEQSFIVGLIGLHCSERLYFVDALTDVARSIPNLVFLVVGEGKVPLSRIVERAERQGLAVVGTGMVPQQEVKDYFAAIDIGLFPADQTPYFDACCPLKVLEYTAARKPVVATDLVELRNWGYPNVHLAPPTREAFAQAVGAAASQHHYYPDTSGFSWPMLCDRLLAILDEVAARGKRNDRSDLSPLERSTLVTRD